MPELRVSRDHRTAQPRAARWGKPTNLASGKRVRAPRGEMKVGVVSDVHNNIEALAYALAHLRDCDVVLSLGDLVSDYRLDPRVVGMARDAHLLGIAGNHEERILMHPGPS